MPLVMQLNCPRWDLEPAVSHSCDIVIMILLQPFLQVDRWNRPVFRLMKAAMSHHRYPSSDNELMLYRVLQHANLVQYYEAFVSQGRYQGSSVRFWEYILFLPLEGGDIVIEVSWFQKQFHVFSYILGIVRQLGVEVRFWSGLECGSRSVTVMDMDVVQKTRITVQPRNIYVESVRYHCTGQVLDGTTNPLYVAEFWSLWVPSIFTVWHWSLAVIKVMRSVLNRAPKDCKNSVNEITARSCWLLVDPQPTVSKSFVQICLLFLRNCAGIGIGIGKYTYIAH